jgi:exoribonuclease-2
LRRAVDFVNQQQLIAMVTDTPPRFARNDASLFAVLRDFDAAYTAYGQFQSKMERYWCLRWLQQENITDTTATWLKEDLVRLENLPFTFRLAGLPSELTPGTRLRLQIISMDELEQQLECRYLGLCDVEPPIAAEESV